MIALGNIGPLRLNMGYAPLRGAIGIWLPRILGGTGGQLGSQHLVNELTGAQMTIFGNGAAKGQLKYKEMGVTIRLSLDGINSVAWSNNASRPVGYSMSSFTWMFHVTRGAAVNETMVMDGTGFGGNGYYINIFNGLLYFTVTTTQINGSATVPLDTPQLIVATKNGNTGTLYRNGVQVATGNLGAGTAPTTNFIIASYSGSQIWVGDWGPTILWSRPLSAAEVRNLYETISDLYLPVTRTALLSLVATPPSPPGAAFQPRPGAAMLSGVPMV